jgi:hypothetical protein
MTARTGMANLISDLRGLAEAGTAEYTIIGSGGTVTYFDDDQLQNILDTNRRDVIFEPLAMYPTQISGGSLSYQDYRSHFGYYEATTGGTAIFYLQDSTGANIGTSLYTPDYRRGQVQFSSNQGGSVYYVTGRSYDLNSAAAGVWRQRAAHYSATSFDFSTDNHSVSRSQVYQHCLEMASFFEGMSGESIQTIPMFRSDI